jgi:hypothetical protein
MGMAPILQVLAIGALPQVLTTTCPGLLRSVGENGLLFRLSLMTCALTLVSILFGLRWGTIGVACALTVKFYAELPLVLAPCLRRTQTTWRDLGRAMRGVLVATGLLTAVGFALHVTFSAHLPPWQLLTLQIGAGALVYWLAVWFVDRPLATEVLDVVRRKKIQGPKPSIA